MTLTQGALDGASVIELLATFVIVFHAGRAVVSLVSGQGLDVARLVIADGVLAALGFSLAATLLKVISLQQWAQIRTFATVFVLRTLLKRVFQHERVLAVNRAATTGVSATAGTAGNPMAIQNGNF